jgi:branched-chain amino acid transport protein
MSIVAYVAVMAGVTYLIRMLPLTLFRKEIKSKFFRRFLYYIPYAVLSAMTIPAIFYCVGDEFTVQAVIGTAAAVILALFNMPLIVVALVAAAAVFISGLFL